MCACAHACFNTVQAQGLNPASKLVTVVCTEDYYTGEKIAYEFARLRAEDPGRVAATTASMVAAFDSARSLCAFNGVRFDISFLQTSLGIPSSTSTQWVLKTTDILESCRLVHGHTFSLNLLCEANSIPVKISSGLHAIHMAEAREWEPLRAYCADDVSILCKLYRMRRLTNPRTKAVMDLAEWAHPLMYEQAEDAVDVEAELADAQAEREFACARPSGYVHYMTTEAENDHLFDSGDVTARATSPAPPGARE